MVKASYAFVRFGPDTIAAYALRTHGWGALDPATKSPVVQQDEYDFDVPWRPKVSWKAPGSVPAMHT